MGSLRLCVMGNLVRSLVCKISIQTWSIYCKYYACDICKTVHHQYKDYGIYNATWPLV